MLKKIRIKVLVLATSGRLYYHRVQTKLIYVSERTVGKESDKDSGDNAIDVGFKDQKSQTTANGSKVTDLQHVYVTLLYNRPHNCVL